MPGPGSTFTYLNTMDSSGVIIYSDTTVSTVLGIISYAGYSNVMMIQEKYLAKNWGGYTDTLYARLLSNGDIAEYLSTISNDRAWFYLPFGSKQSQTQSFGTMLLSYGSVGFDSMTQNSTYEGLSVVQVKGSPALAQTVNVTSRTSKTTGPSNFDSSLDTVQYYSIVSNGIPFAGEKVLSNIAFYESGDVRGEASAYPTTTTLIDYKILP
jgi:hypothetical protein